MKVPARMRRVRRGAILSAGGAVVSAGVLLVVMTPGLADVGECGLGNSSGNIRTCVSVGLHTASASVNVVSSARVLNFCLYVNGQAKTCSGYGYYSPGSGSSVDTIYAGVSPSATYCAVTWKKAPDGSVTLVDQECMLSFHG